MAKATQASNTNDQTQTQDRPATIKQDPLLTIKEAAIQLGVPYSTIHGWCQPQNGRRRRIKVVRWPGGSFRIRQSTVDQILLGTDDQHSPIPDYKD